MNTILFDILLILISVCTCIVTKVFVPWIKEHVDNKKLQNIVKWVEYAVDCAEMIYKNETGKGVFKKQFVVDFIDKQFNAEKKVLTRSQIEILVERAVKSMNENKTENN